MKKKGDPFLPQPFYLIQYKLTFDRKNQNKWTWTKLILGMLEHTDVLSFSNEISSQIFTRYKLYLTEIILYLTDDKLYLTRYRLYP